MNPSQIIKTQRVPRQPSETAIARVDFLCKISKIKHLNGKTIFVQQFRSFTTTFP